MTRLEIAARIAAGLAANPTVKQSLIVASSLYFADKLIQSEAETRPEPEPESKPEPEPEQELPFVMVVGGVYEDRKGRIEEIVGSNAYSIFSFTGKSGRRYTKEGICHLAHNAEYDLIKRIR